MVAIVTECAAHPKVLAKRAVNPDRHSSDWTRTMSSLSGITPQILTPRDTIAAQATQQRIAAAAEANASANAGASVAVQGNPDTTNAANASNASNPTNAGPTGANRSAAGGSVGNGRDTVSGPDLRSLGAQSQDGTQATDGSSESVAVKTIKEQIAQIQKQLAAVMQQIQAVQSGTMDERTKANMLGGLQAQANTLQGALQQAMGKLAAAIKQEGASPTGNLVNTTA